MKISQYLGIILWIFAVVTLLNLIDTMQTLAKLDAEMEIVQIATWVGIAFTEFVLGFVLIMGGETEGHVVDRFLRDEIETKKKQPKQPMKTEDIKKMKVLSVVSSLIGVGFFLWTIELFSGKYSFPQPYVFLQQFIFRLILFAIFIIISSLLWDKAKKEAWLRRGLEKPYSDSKQPTKHKDINKMKILSVVISLIGVGFPLWAIPDFFRFNLQLFFKLALFAIFEIIGSVLWEKSKESKTSSTLSKQNEKSPLPSRFFLVFKVGLWFC